MLFPLIILFTVIPAIELFLLIQVGGYIGAWNTVGVIILTGVVGATMARSQGHLIMMKVQSELARGGVPADGLLQGLMVFIGGLLLITPGIITDIVGFCLVIPVTRWLFVKMVKTHFEKAIRKGKYKFQNMNMQGQPGAAGGGFHVYTSHSTTAWQNQENGIRDVVDVSAEKILPSQNSSDSE